MNPVMPDVITIRGAPGVGKTETSKLLSEHFDHGVYIEVDRLRSMVISVDWTNQTEHIQMLSTCTDLVVSFFRYGYKPVIVVDTFSGDKLSGFITDLRRKVNGVSVRSFALITDVPTLKGRIDRRPKNDFRNLDVCLKLNGETENYAHQGEVVIDNSNLTARATADVILSRLKSTAPSTPPTNIGA